MKKIILIIIMLFCVGCGDVKENVNFNVTSCELDEEIYSYVLSQHGVKGFPSFTYHTTQKFHIGQELKMTLEAQ